MAIPTPRSPSSPLVSRRWTFHLTPGTTAVLALTGANILWGGSAAASKEALAHVPPMTLATLRVALALAVLHLLLARNGERPATGIAPALLGLTGVALFCVCQNVGLGVADAATTSLLNGAIPILTALLGMIWLGERMGQRRLAGLALSVVGVAMIGLDGAFVARGMAALGNLLLLASAASFAVYAVLGRRTFGGANTLSVVAGSTFYGLLFLLPGAFTELATNHHERLTRADGLLVLYLGVACSALALVVAGYGLAHLEAGHAAIFGNIKPLVGVGLAVVLLGEPVTLPELAGGVMILLGVALASGLSFAGAPRLIKRDRGGRRRWRLRRGWTG
jgi:drug/metabolite transporter (DMT)-like permease